MAGLVRDIQRRRASCAGLTRASMKQLQCPKPYEGLPCVHVIMDCRVKPGNDAGRAVAERLRGY
jgi:hypothetical protein